MPNPNLLADLELFHGELTTNRAFVYARLAEKDSREGWLLRGTVRGPLSAQGETLPSTHPLADAGPGASLLAKALVPDPVFWSPFMPATYAVTVELVQQGNVLARAERAVGFRSLGIRAGQLFQASQRIVIRGAFTTSVRADSLTDWKGADLWQVLANSADATPVEAAQLGIPLIGFDSGDSTAGLRQLSQNPAVGIAITSQSEACLTVAPNLLAARYLSASDLQAETALEPSTKLVLAEVNNPATFAQQVSRFNLPVMAVRRLTERVSLSEARTACDHLQRDLAPYAQFAGYLV